MDSWFAYREWIPEADTERVLQIGAALRAGRRFRAIPSPKNWLKMSRKNTAARACPAPPATLD